MVFFGRDRPFYAEHRDLRQMPGARIVLYSDWAAIAALAGVEVRSADAALVTSYCPDGPQASRLVWDNARRSVFYDMDTPVTLARLEAGETVDYLPPEGLGDFDLVLSFTGGSALDVLRSQLGARRTAPLYGHVDPAQHHPAAPEARFEAALSYLGTYAADRQPALERLFLEPARQRPDLRFLIGGAQYPETFPWTENIFFTGHLEPAQHPGFFCSGRATLNVTRRAMAEYGFCPSGRLFEAAACGVPLLSDGWEGLDEFFTPGTEILRADTAADVLRTLCLSDTELNRVAEAARTRTLKEHTADARVLDLERVLSGLRRSEELVSS